MSGEIKGERREQAANFKLRLTEEGKRWRDELFAMLPKACPACNFTSPDALWKLSANDSYYCMNCGALYIPLKS